MLNELFGSNETICRRSIASLMNEKRISNETDISRPPTV